MIGDWRPPRPRLGKAMSASRSRRYIALPAKYADDPQNANVPVQIQIQGFQKGSRWEVRWRTDGTTRRNCPATTAKLRVSWPRLRTGYGLTGRSIPGTHANPWGRLRTYGDRISLRLRVRPGDATCASYASGSLPDREMRSWVILPLCRSSTGASALPKGLRLIGKWTRFRLPTVCIIDSLSG